MKISILIPVYNEAATLPELLRRVQLAELPSGCTREIIVVNDGSNDGTAAALSALKDITVIHHDRNRGKGAAIRSGLGNATGDVILIQDGDLEYDPNDYVALLDPIVQGRSEIVYGSRFAGLATGMTSRNRLANRLFTASANILYGANLSDLATGYKAFKADILRRVALRSERFEFCAEVTGKLLSRTLQIHEVPISYRARTVAQGKKIRASDGLRSLWTLMRLRFVRSDVVPITRSTNMQLESTGHARKDVA